MEYHKLLLRQLNKSFNDESLKDPQLLKFIEAVNNSYNSYDRDRDIIENAFNISENEYQAVNQNLENEVNIKRVSIQKLKDSLSKVDTSHSFNSSEEGDDILAIVDYLNLQIEKRKQVEDQIVKQEEKFRNIIANMNLGLLEVDLDEVIQFANQSFCAMSGFKLSELLGKNCNKIILNKRDKKVIGNNINPIPTESSTLYELEFITKSGEKRWWAFSSAPRNNDNGVLLGSVGIYLDITAQKQLEYELKIAKDKAEESSKAKESFLATMSHEIRTPLNAIIGIADLMQLSPKLRNKENLDTLSFSAKNLLALITDILDISKIEAGKIELSNNVIDLKQVINGVFQTFNPVCEEKNLELIIAMNPNIPESIIGDELRLSQILNNLISNAIKFTPKGYVKINIEAQQITNEKIRLHFKLSDSGIGIPKNKIDTIFNAFEQADKSIVRKYGGTGLGLNITKKLIELQGGSISVESKLNIGSVFSFFIDYEISNQKKIRRENKNQNKKESSNVLLNKTILLVEDNIANQKVAVSYLNHWGLQWDIANNGKEALELLEYNTYDLALIDLYMPVMDGFEAIKKIRKNPTLKRMPIIALTASAEINLMNKAISFGAEKCLSKPFNSQELHETIMELMNS